MTSFVVRPGTVSCFWPNSGTQKEWMTSSDLSRSSTLRPTGRRRSPEVRCACPGYEKLHADCCAVTSTRIGFRPALPFFARTIALTIAIATTRAVGLVVGRHAELPDRVADDGGDDGEDRDADHRHEPEDEVDAAGFAACGSG